MIVSRRLVKKISPAQNCFEVVLSECSFLFLLKKLTAAKEASSVIMATFLLVDRIVLYMKIASAPDRL